MIVWAACSLAGVPPLNRSLDEDGANAVLRLLAVPGLAFYLVAFVALPRALPASAGRRWRLALFAAYVLLAEALLAVTFGRNWHASWWEWHVLMLVAFVIVARDGPCRVPAVRVVGRRVQRALPGPDPQAGRPADRGRPGAAGRRHRAGRVHGLGRRHHGDEGRHLA